MKTIEQRIKALEQQAQSAVKFAPGGGAAAVARLTVGGGATIGQIGKYQFPWLPGSIAANTVFVLTWNIPGLNVSDWVYVIPPATSNVPPCAAVVTAPGNLLVMFVNALTTAQTPASGTYTVIAIRA